VPAFIAPVDYAVGDRPLDVKVGDFNNDGRSDLVTANYYDGTVSVLLGNADGTFQPARTSATGFRPASLAVGDFNQDGKLDLATDSYGGTYYGDVSILLGQGDGRFGPAADIPLGSGYVPSIATGDLNADGKLDLVATSADYNMASVAWSFVDVLIGHGDGSFAATRYGPYFDGLPSLALGDFDGDGNADVAASLDSLKVFLTNGDGTLQEPRNVDGGGIPLTVADFDADGKLDLATTTFDGVRVLRGNGDGTFQPAPSAAIGAFPTSVKADDVSGDGVLDLVVTNQDAVGGLTVLRGNGDGSFGPPIRTAVGSRGDSLVVADFNGDGRPDAAVTDYSQDRVTVLFNDGAWSLDDPPSVSIVDATVKEATGVTINATFTVILSHATDVDVTVHYHTADISAAAGNDYQAVSGTLIIPAGQTTGTIIVLVNDDRLGEVNEAFVVTLSSASNATIVDGQAVGTILDNEPRISISDLNWTEGKKGKKTTFIFTVTLSAAYDQPVTVSYRTVDGTATTGDNDYIARTGTLTFAPGETKKTVAIDVKGDSKREANETFYLDLFGNSGNSLLSKKRGIGTILNDD
jgi:hypothetical protein